MALVDTTLRGLKPQEKPKKYSDGGGLGGFNRSSQHPVVGGVDDDRKTEIRALDAA